MVPRLTGEAYAGTLPEIAQHFFVALDGLDQELLPLRTLRGLVEHHISYLRHVVLSLRIPELSSP